MNHKLVSLKNSKIILGFLSIFNLFTFARFKIEEILYIGTLAYEDQVGRGI